MCLLHKVGCTEIERDSKAILALTVNVTSFDGMIIIPSTLSVSSSWSCAEANEQ